MSVLQISEAFEVLNDKNKRAVYDQFGEEGLKGGGAPPPGTDGFPGGGSFGGFPSGTTFTFSTNAGGRGFAPSDPISIFE